MRKKGKHINESKKSIFLYILILCLVILAIGKMSYSKYASEIRQEAFNIEFIAGDIQLTATDSYNEFVIVPGKIITKDTKITVKANSEACFIFVKLEKSNNFDDYIEYEIASEWSELSENIYFCELDKTISDTDYEIFNNNQILVKEDVEKQNYENVDENNITLNFTAYAVQKTSEISTVTAAWDFINSRDTVTP